MDCEGGAITAGSAVVVNTAKQDARFVPAGFVGIAEGDLLVTQALRCVLFAWFGCASGKPSKTACSCRK